MSISTNWKDDGALVIRCGDEELEIPATRFGGGGDGSGGGAGPKPVLPMRFLPDITPGKPNVICGGVVTVKPLDVATIETMDGLAAVVRQAMAKTIPPTEIVCGWNSKNEISIAEVREVIRGQRAGHLTLQLFPMFPDIEV